MLLEAMHGHFLVFIYISPLHEELCVMVIFLRKIFKFKATCNRVGSFLYLIIIKVHG